MVQSKTTDNGSNIFFLLPGLEILEEFVNFWNQNILWSLKKYFFNPLSAKPTKWSNTLKQFVGIFPMNYLKVFNHFEGLASKGLKDKEPF